MTICRTPIPDPRVEYPAYYLLGVQDCGDCRPVSHIHYRYSFVAIWWLALRWWWQGYLLVTLQAVRPLTPEERATFFDWTS